MLLDKEIEVKIGNNVSYYEKLGYEIPRQKSYGRMTVPRNTTILVKPKDMKDNSHTIVNVLCDYCQETITQMEYRHYKSQIDRYGTNACSACGHFHYQETMHNKYGVDNGFQLEEIKEKSKKTNLEKRGYEYVSQDPKVQEKIVKTSIERYGAINYIATEEAREKCKAGAIAKYGTDNPFSSKLFQEEMISKNLELYGVEYNMQRPEIREKVSKTLYSNSSQKVSSQQSYIHSLFGGELNYPFNTFSLDIYQPDEKIVIEVDFGGHNLPVKMGKMSQEDFDKREMIREKMIRTKGLKIIRLISPNDKLPTDDKLFEIYNFAKQYFKTTNHTWINFYLEENKYRNAEHRDEFGAFYNFGELWNGKILAKKQKEVNDVV